MIADIDVREKSFGPKTLMTGVKFSVDDKEKIGIIGRNGVGKSTLFSILTGDDQDYTGDITYRRGVTVVATAQEHGAVSPNQTVLQYILAGLPEYPELSHIIEAYPETMGNNMTKIARYTEALEWFEQRGFYQIESDIERELENFQLSGVAHRPFASLSGGQKRLVEVVKVMHSGAHLALLDEPTNHMDYVAKKQFIDWMKQATEAMLIITHDRDVLREVDRIVELKDGGCVSFKGNYDAYLKQNAVHTGTAMNEFEMVEKRISNLKDKVIQYQRLKEKARNPSTIANFKRLETQAREELIELEAKQKPTFWIDKDSVEGLNYKVATQYDKFKARNIRMSMKSEESRSKHVLVGAKDLALGYGDNILFEGVNIDLREGEAVELRGRNGAGKTTLIRALLNDFPARLHSPFELDVSRHDESLTNSLRPAGRGDLSPRQSSVGQELAPASSGLAATTLKEGGGSLPESRNKRVVRESEQQEEIASSNFSQLLNRSDRTRETAILRAEHAAGSAGDDESGERREQASGKDQEEPASGELIVYTGEIKLDPHVRVGIYEQEVSPTYFDLTLHDAIERVYLDRNLTINDTKIRQLMSDYLFIESDMNVKVERLSGGQKARLQIIQMLANDPQLLILDEPTNHLDLPSIEELEIALGKYSGAILYVSHDSYFRDAIGGDVVQIG